MNLHEHKKLLRNEIKQRRSKLSEVERMQMSQQISLFLHEITEFKRAKSVFCYISYMDEVETHPLITDFIRQNLALAVPKIINITEMLAISLSDFAELEPDKLGILTPKSSQAAPNSFDIAITPGLGFTETGDRLGYGRGYYDRWFSKNEVKTKIGLAFEVQIVDELPLEKTDMPLDILVTEKRIIDLRKTD
jgi:5-formyltetrahydrofolate cyclo-ligase